MGNHEWCPECEEDDYHYGKPCNPKKVEQVRQRKAQQKLMNDEANVRMEKALKDAGIPYEIEYLRGERCCYVRVLNHHWREAF